MKFFNCQICARELSVTYRPRIGSHQQECPIRATSDSSVSHYTIFFDDHCKRHISTKESNSHFPENDKNCYLIVYMIDSYRVYVNLEDKKLIILQKPTLDHLSYKNQLCRIDIDTTQISYFKNSEQIQNFLIL